MSEDVGVVDGVSVSGVEVSAGVLVGVSVGVVGVLLGVSVEPPDEMSVEVGLSPVLIGPAIEGRDPLSGRTGDGSAAVVGSTRVSQPGRTHSARMKIVAGISPPRASRPPAREPWRTHRIISPFTLAAARVDCAITAATAVRRPRPGERQGRGGRRDGLDATVGKVPNDSNRPVIIAGRERSADQVARVFDVGNARWSLVA